MSDFASLSDASGHLLDALKPAFAEHGYKLRKSCRDFVKKESNGDASAISVDLIRSSVKGCYKVSVNCHIRIEALESVYAKHHLYVSEKERKKPLHD